MSASAPDLDFDAAVSPAAMAANERKVRRGFWRKLAGVASSIPFAQQAAAAYFCALDPETPTRAKAILLGALAYFILPVDLVPDFVAGLGFTDDAAVMFAALNVLGAHLRQRHYEQADQALDRLKNGG